MTTETAKHGTGIEWTHRPGTTGETWNPVVGCSIASPGCSNCYAMAFAGLRLDREGGPPQYQGTTREVNGKYVWTGKVALAEHKLQEPLRWTKPRTIFVNSMGDLFHESVPVEWIDKVFAVMSLCPQHTFIILTKRSARMREYMLGTEPGGDRTTDIHIAANAICLEHKLNRAPLFYHPFPHVWLGVSAERQKEADERIPDLLATPAAVRFVSAEPLLGGVNLTRIEAAKCGTARPRRINALTGEAGHYVGGDPKGDYLFAPNSHRVPRLDWVLVGGESGPGARPMALGWAKDIVRQCQSASVPVFVKQLGANPTNRKGERCSTIRHRKGADITEWPEELRLREMPHAV